MIYHQFQEFAVEYTQYMETFYVLANQTAYRDLHEPAFIVAACFALVAVVLSTVLIFQHLRSYTNPAEQKWIVAVILMVPIYATESLSSLWNPRLSLACDILRNCYEAFALYSFGSYLIACLGGEQRVVELLEDEKRKLLEQPLQEEKDEKPKAQHRTLRNFFFQSCVLGKDLLTIEKFGLVQYMILKTVCALLALILELFGVYGDEEFKCYYGYPYIAVVLNFSQMWALYCLVQFYNVTHEKLRAIKPLAKFISFKAIVFATWWQGVGIALLSSLNVLPREGEFETGLQDFLICMEMAIAAVAHVFVFSTKPYHYLPISEYGKITTQTSKETVKQEGGQHKGKPAQVKSLKVDTEIEASGTSVKESIQDIVVEGGQHVVNDVVLTINQAIEPVEKGITKIQEKLHISVSEDDDEEKQKQEVKVEEHVEENSVDEGNQKCEVKVEEHVEEKSVDVRKQELDVEEHVQEKLVVDRNRGN